jgi:hypothetical protein
MKHQINMFLHVALNKMGSLQSNLLRYNHQKNKHLDHQKHGFFSSKEHVVHDV